jgi:hypothetical protein
MLVVEYFRYGRLSSTSLLISSALTHGALIALLLFILFTIDFLYRHFA